MGSRRLRRFLLPVSAAWRAFARVLGTVSGSLLFGLFYIFVLGLYALLRWIGALFQSKVPHPRTYWKVRRYRPATLVNMRRPF